MAKMLFHVIVGSENPTRASLPFLQAVANKERGDEVHIALAGDGTEDQGKVTVLLKSK